MLDALFTLADRLMGYPVATLRVETNLDSSEVIERLEKAVQSPESVSEKLPAVVTNVPMTGAKFTRPVEEEPEQNLMGDVDGQRFRLWLRARDEETFTTDTGFGTYTRFTSFHPILEGRVVEKDEGAVIHGHFAPHRFVSGLVLCWLFGSAIAGQILAQMLGFTGEAPHAWFGVYIGASLPVMGLVVTYTLGTLAGGLLTAEMEQIDDQIETLVK